MDISETGIISLILDTFKPLYESAGLSTGWITLLGIILGIVGIGSLIVEIIVIWSKGWLARIIAFLGFSSFILILLGIDTLGVILLLIGGFLVAMFPNE